MMSKKEKNLLVERFNPTGGISREFSIFMGLMFLPRVTSLIFLYLTSTDITIDFFLPLSLLPPLLLPLITLRFSSFFTLDLSHKPLILLLIGSITFLLLFEALRSKYVSVFPKLPDSALSFTLVLFLKLSVFSTGLIWIIVTIWVEVFFEFRYRGLNC